MFALFFSINCGSECYSKATHDRLKMEPETETMKRAEALNANVLESKLVAVRNAEERKLPKKMGKTKKKMVKMKHSLQSIICRHKMNHFSEV